MSKLEKAKERARALETKDAKGAVEAWIEVLKEQDASGEPNPDLVIYNKVGDLWLKLKDPGQAADYYDRAVARDPSFALALANMSIDQLIDRLRQQLPRSP